MLQNTRERTVFAFQPKRLPKDVDRRHSTAFQRVFLRLRFFQGSIVRKKSLGSARIWLVRAVGSRGDTDDEEERVKEGVSGMRPALFIGEQCFGD